MKQTIPIMRQRNSPQSITPHSRPHMFSANRRYITEGSSSRYMGIRTEEVEMNK
jgi:hypothetical protein